MTKTTSSKAIKTKQSSASTAINQRHGIKFKAVKKAWVSRPDILVFEQMTSKWYNAPVNQMLPHIGKQGGLHPARFPYTYCVWCFMLSSVQQYYVKLLSHTPHYAIRYRDYKYFKRHLKMRGYKSKHIGQNESFVPLPSTPQTPEDEKPFLAVFNVGTKEMDATMISLIKEMKLDNTFDLLAGVKADARGNVQKTFGFSPVGYKRHPDNHCIPMPQALQGNQDERVRDKYATFTSLRAYTMKKHPGVKEMVGFPLNPIHDKKRKRLFAESIHPANVHDNMTAGGNILKDGEIKAFNLSQGAKKKLRIHVDSFNDPTIGNQVQGNCSQVFIPYTNKAQIKEVVRQGSTTGKNSELRAFNSFYMKHACEQAVERKEWMLSLFSVVDPYHAKTPKWRHTFKGSVRYASRIAARKEATRKERRRRPDSSSHEYSNTLDRIVPFKRSFDKGVILGNISDSKYTLAVLPPFVCSCGRRSPHFFDFLNSILNVMILFIQAFGHCMMFIHFTCIKPSS
jgi:hypothetical protein